MLERISNIMTIASFKLNQTYELEKLKEVEESLHISPLWFVAIALVLVPLCFYLLFKLKNMNEVAAKVAVHITFLLGILFLTLGLMIVLNGSLTRPILVKDMTTMIEAVEEGGFKGVHFLRNVEGVKDVQDDVLYLTIKSVNEENFENVIGKEETITIRQEIDKFKEKGIYQAILVNEGSPDEHMLLIELVGDGTVIKLDDYQNIENQKRYIVEQMEKEFISLKKEDLQ